MSSIIIGIICFILGMFIGMIVTSLMTASKIDSVYTEVEHILKVVDKT